MSKKLDTVFDEKELLDITQNLIRIESSTSCPAREQNVADFLLTLFKKEGIPCHLQEIEDGRGNVIAVLKGNGTQHSLMLNGHMDTVPPGRMKHPFSADIKDGILSGRGAADMKGGLAAMAYALILLHRMEVLLGGDVVFTGVIDEEAAKSTGSRYLAEHGPKTDYAIVGEPTGLHPVIAHKGIDYFAVSFHGKAAHSSEPSNGVNAIYAASEYILTVKNRLIPEYNRKVHPLVGGPTVNVGLVRGCAEANRGYLDGNAATFAGIVPDQCTVWLDVRWIPGQSAETILKDLKKLCPSVEEKYPGLSIEAEYIPLPRPAMDLAPDDLLTLTVTEQVKICAPDFAQVQGAQYFADSGILYGVGGIRSMVFGPGNISFAHAENEQIETDQIISAAKIYAQTAKILCGLEI